MKRKLIEHDYALYSYGINEARDTFVVNYSRLGNWAPEYKGKVAAKIVDDGNGATVSLNNGLCVRLDYCELSELYLLLKLYRKEIV